MPLLRGCCMLKICNDALLLLGEKPIDTMDEESDTAALCNGLYIPTLESVLRSHMWNFAKKRIILSPLEEKPVFGFQNKFLMPSDWIRTISISEYPNHYEIEAGHILADSNEVRLHYIFRNENISTWDSAFKEVVVLTLAAKMAVPVTQSAAFAQDLQSQARQALRSAKSINGQETPPDKLQGSPLYWSRR